MMERDPRTSQEGSLFNPLPPSSTGAVNDDTVGALGIGPEELEGRDRNGTSPEGHSSQRSDEAWLTQMTAKGVPPLIARAQVQFRRDLPELIGSHAGDWVAYSGEERIGVGSDEKELVLRCVGRGLRDDQFVVRAIAPGVEEVLDPAEWSHL